MTTCLFVLHVYLVITAWHFVCLFVCLFACLFVCLFACLFACSSYITYDYTVDAGTNNCNGVTRKCSGSVPSLIQRSWFINPVKSQFGKEI